MQYSDLNVIVTGAGVAGVGAAKMLVSLGNTVFIADDNETALARALEVTGASGGTTVQAQDLLDDANLVVTSPGWPPTTPFLEAAAARGVEVIGDVELCYRLDRAEVFGQPRTWMVITGTNGKTTTTQMLTAMMQEAGVQAAAVGNIGVSIAEALQQQNRIDVLVAELSSFQLHWSSQLRPDVGILLNLAEDHLDWHGSMQAYAEAKAKVLQAPIAIAGIDDAMVREYAPGAYGFTLAPPKPGQVGIVEHMLIDAAFDHNLVVAPAVGIQPPGPAGLYDALAAVAAARSQGVEPAAIARALANFQAAAHRGQIVATKGTIVAVDNSKATNPHAADIALAAYDRVIWIAGGQLKGAQVDELVQRHADKLQAVGLLGVDRAMIAEAVQRYAPHAEIFTVDSQDPHAAMHALAHWAVARAVPGDAIVLAPAAASLDMYTGMGQRGDIFAAAINAEFETS
ncbi:UDP-N-acetylmuramoyl-L-alanine--D-glutamate ligase [Corynebacterium sp. HS2168-gen11]|uniref:UDP-N-acetylmuramoyl-L-alanine--D-glutamate ligase n=1 Tax=Corynebacterium sp. HS2168-gen11 TaxID=2974027 RepID=UPI00216AEB89|nr:UDP-N-acetylmuramoyl-L-alanine--D-glutamate ligase [Corynebacterium sp. HS2168-gen11]MCS4536192.1 UDP-N-acetylmuramoyl-L-alanine--D-glutamate ligase [Corynebacterium sp. HS2168-gen11]